MSNPAFFTIVSSNYLAYAKTLFASIRDHYPGADLTLCIVDDPAVAQRELGSECRVVPVASLDLPHREHFLFRYGVMELNTAVKPYVFRWVFDNVPSAANGAMYIDPDIRFFRRLSEVEALFTEGASVVLTPHLTAPLNDDRMPSELTIMRSGAYNCGFVGVGNHPARAQFIDWWAARLEHGAYVDFDAGIFTDQKWIDLAPGLFPDVRILRHPGYNTAYWNLAHRTITRGADGFRVNGEPLAFFHFSGISLSDPHALSKYQNRFTEDDLGEFRSAYRDYLAALGRNGQEVLSKEPYAFGRDRAGRPIVAEMRQVFRHNLDVSTASPVDDPFGIDPRLFDEPTDALPKKAPRLSRLVFETWKRRPSLREAFDPHTATGREGLLAWFVAQGEGVVGVDASHVGAARTELDAYRASNGARTEDRTDTHPMVAKLQGATSRLILRELAKVRGSQRWRALFKRLPAPMQTLAQRKFVRTEAQLSLVTSRAVLNERRAAPAAARCEAGLNLVGYFRGDFGVAECARAYARSLLDAPVPVDLLDFDVGVPPQRLTDSEFAARFSRQPRFERNVCFVNADQTQVLFRSMAHVLAGRYNIGYWFWELARLPEQWRAALDLVDEVWVASEFVRQAVLHADRAKPVRVIPYPIHFDLQRSYSKSDFGLDSTAFTFLYSFDYYSYVERKNPAAVIRAFRAAFPSTADRSVALVLKSMGADRGTETAAAIAEMAASDPRIRLIDRPFSRADMHGLESVCDSYISLHRSEGFGLGLAESMYLGKPVIGTGYSGNLQFMNPSNSCLVDFRLVDIEEGSYPQSSGQQWADPDIADAARCMQRVYSDAEFRAAIAKRGAEDIRQHMSRGAASAAMVGELQRIRRGRAVDD